MRRSTRPTVHFLTHTHTTRQITCLQTNIRRKIRPSTDPNPRGGMHRCLFSSSCLLDDVRQDVTAARLVHDKARHDARAGGRAEIEIELAVVGLHRDGAVLAAEEADALVLFFCFCFCWCVGVGGLRKQ